MSQDDLRAFFFDEPSCPLASPLAACLASSRHFGAFVTGYRTKVRKKLRAAQDPETVRDLGLELETAYLLLRERSLSLEYEPQASAKACAPDFAVSYTSSSVFMVEVTPTRQEKSPKRRNGRSGHRQALLYQPSRPWAG